MEHSAAYLPPFESDLIESPVDVVQSIQDAAEEYAREQIVSSTGSDVIDRQFLRDQIAEEGYAEPVGYDRHRDIAEYDTPYAVGTRLSVVMQRQVHDSEWQDHGSITGTVMASVGSAALPHEAVRLMPDQPLPSDAPEAFRNMHPRPVSIDGEPFWHSFSPAHKVLFRRLVSVEGDDANFETV